jgi:hypothetical protein
VGEQRPVLEHHADPTLLGSQVGAVAAREVVADGDLAVVDPLEAGDGPQERGLAAAARAEECHRLVLGDVEGHLPQDLGLAEALDDAADVDPARALFHAAPGYGRSGTTPGPRVRRAL